MLDEVLVESISKVNVKDEVMLTSIVTVETNIIINASFVQHVEERGLVRVGQWAAAAGILTVIGVATIIASGVFYFEKIWRLIMIQSAHFLVEELSPVSLGQSWEECVELSFQGVRLNHLHERVVGQQLLLAWLPVVWRR